MASPEYRGICGLGTLCRSQENIGGPNGFRTRVSGVRGQRPGPLDDGTIFRKP